MGSRNLPRSVTAARLAQEIAAGGGIRLLDVRTTAEFERAHIADSYNVPLAELSTHAEALRAVDGPLVLVCRSDARARAAEELLARAGARRLHVLEGGILAWRRAALPVSGRKPSAAAIARRALGVLGLVIAFLAARENPLMGVVLGFVGLRLAMGHGVLPCAAAGSCQPVANDTHAIVRSLVEGPPRHPLPEPTTS